MSLASSRYSQLSAYAGLTALVSTRIYPNRAPQDATLPYVVYFRVGGSREQAFTNAVGATGVRMQFSAFAAAYIDADAVRAQVRAALLAYVTSGGVTVHEVALESDLDQYENDTFLHHCLTEAVLLVGGDL